MSRIPQFRFLDLAKKIVQGHAAFPWKHEVAQFKYQKDVTELQLSATSAEECALCNEVLRILGSEYEAPEPRLRKETLHELRDQPTMQKDFVTDLPSADGNVTLSIPADPKKPLSIIVDTSYLAQIREDLSRGIKRVG